MVRRTAVLFFGWQSAVWWSNTIGCCFLKTNWREQSLIMSSGEHWLCSHLDPTTVERMDTAWVTSLLFWSRKYVEPSAASLLALLLLLNLNIGIVEWCLGGREAVDGGQCCLRNLCPVQSLYCHWFWPCQISSFDPWLTWLTFAWPWCHKVHKVSFSLHGWLQSRNKTKQHGLN